MAGYLNSKKLNNVKGRIEYITDERKQENIVDYYNTTDDEFWSILAKESRERHKAVNARGRCCEARELIIGIPQNSDVTAKEICTTFKDKYNVECNCAIHQNNKNGIINRHCHLIFSERKKLAEPEIKEERRATRTYYYDEKGKKCKKAYAVKVVKKGTLLQKGITRYFSDKDEFFKSQKFIVDCKQIFLKELLGIDWSFEEEKSNKELSERHIGKNNPKEEYVKRNNNLKSMIKDVCKAGDLMFQCRRGETLKKFKKEYHIDSFVATKYKENESKVLDFIEGMQVIYKESVEDEVKDYNTMNKDMEILNREFRYNYNQIYMQSEIITKYKPFTKTEEKPKVIDFLKKKLSDMLIRIKNLLGLQDLLYIKNDERLELHQDRETEKLVISRPYVKEQVKRKSKDHDFYLEL